MKSKILIDKLKLGDVRAVARLLTLIENEDKSVEKIVKERMANMSKIKAYSSKMYPLAMASEFDELKLLNEELLHAAKEFKELFPDGSQGGKASELIWEDRETFELFNDNFIKSIEDNGILCLQPSATLHGTYVFLGKKQGLRSLALQGARKPKINQNFRNFMDFPEIPGKCIEIQNFKGNHVWGCPGANMSAATLEKA